MSNGDTCDVKSPYASIIKVTCPAGDFCSMTTSRGWTSEGVVETTTRGCAAPKTMIGKVHDLGCHVDQRTGAVVCYCNSNFCNGFSYSYSVSCQRVSLLLVIAIPLIILYIQ